MVQIVLPEQESTRRSAMQCKNKQILQKKQRNLSQNFAAPSPCITSDFVARIIALTPGQPGNGGRAISLTHQIHTDYENYFKNLLQLEINFTNEKSYKNRLFIKLLDTSYQAILTVQITRRHLLFLGFLESVQFLGTKRQFRRKNPLINHLIAVSNVTDT